MSKFSKRLLTSLRNFVPANAGNVAATFALATVPIVGFVGSAVDYSRANSTKAALQSALDSVSLMLAKNAATMTSAQLNAQGLAYLKAIYTRPESQNVSINVTYSSTNGSSLKVDGSTTMAANFVGILGYSQLPISASSTTSWGTTRLRVALALDNTGSMQDDGKIGALKTATKNLLTQLKNASSKPGDVYVSIIPFSKNVNVGKNNYNASWIDWEDWEDDNGHDNSTTTCTTTQTGKNGKSTKKCTTSTTWVPDNHNTWNGCVTDRDQPYDQQAIAPTGSATANPSKLFPAEQYDYCPLAMMGLNYDWTSMNSLVDQMYPAGSTNQPIGLVWAWQSLVGGGPLSVPAKEANYIYQDVIILMSDGLNTQDRWYGDGANVSSSVDKRMYDTSTGNGTCANIKATGVTIYTIQVNTGGDPQSTLLKNCASSTDKFWMVTTASGLGTVFSAIGTNLAKLRVAK